MLQQRFSRPAGRRCRTCPDPARGRPRRSRREGSRQTTSTVTLATSPASMPAAPADRPLDRQHVDAAGAVGEHRGAPRAAADRHPDRHRPEPAARAATAEVTDLVGRVVREAQERPAVVACGRSRSTARRRRRTPPAQDRIRVRQFPAINWTITACTMIRGSVQMKPAWARSTSAGRTSGATLVDTAGWRIGRRARTADRTLPADGAAAGTARRDRRLRAGGDGRRRTSP